MPFVRISVTHDVNDKQLQHVADAAHRSLVSVFNVPEADRFQVLTRHAANELICTPEYMGVVHGSSIAFIQITCNEGRTLEMKKALFAALAESISAGGAIKRQGSR